MSETPEKEPVSGKSAKNTPLRAVCLSGGVEDTTIGLVTDRILEFFAKDRKKTITLLLSSAGGNIRRAAAFWGMMRYLRVPLKVVVFGEAYSASIVVLCAGRERIASNDARIIFHPFRKAFDGREFDESEVGVILAEMRRHREIFCRVVAETAGRKPEEIRALISSPHTLTANEAQELGLLTGIWDPFKG